MTNKLRLRWLIIPILGILLIGFCAILLSPICTGLWSKLIAFYDLLTDRERVQGLVLASGWAGPLILIALHVAQVLLAPIPGDAFSILGGYLFGTINGFLLSTLGMTIGSVLNFYFGRLVGNRVVRRIVSARTYAKYNRLVHGKRIFLIFLLFLVPGSPKDILCILLGLTTIPIRIFILLSAVARMPTTVAFSIQGAAIFSRDYTLFTIVSIGCVLFAALAFISRDTVDRWMGSPFEKPPSRTI
jgi:uncharacterized membrane protein YdjX (TVP38/TMEM64 family)